MNQQEIDDLLQKLNSKGEKTVRLELAQGIYGERKLKIVNNWLNEMEKKRNEEKYQALDQTEERRHKEMLEVNRSLRNSSWIAAITSIISAIVAIVAAIITIYYPK